MGFISNFLANLSGKVVYLGGVGARSRPWNRSIEEQEICASILDCNATHTAKAQVLHVVMDEKGRVREIKRRSPYTKLFEKPNPVMSKQDFLYAMSWQLDLKNTALAWIEWDGDAPKAIWPIAYGQFEICRVQGGGFAVQFTDMDGARRLLWLEDMVILRRHYDASGAAGQGNQPVGHTLQLVESLDDSLTSAVTISNKIHGLLKQKKAMLAPDAVKQSQAEFRARMEAAAKDGGVVTLDSTEDYTPLNVTAWAANAAQMQQVTARLYGYWRTPAEVVNNTASEQVMQNYYDSIVEPRWEEMSQAFTDALFSRREKDVGNRILLFGGAATGASWGTKLNIINSTRETGLLTTNEYRELLGYAPVEDGDQRFVSLNYVKSSDMSKYQVGVSSVDTPPQEQGEPTNAAQTE